MVTHRVGDVSLGYLDLVGREEGVFDGGVVDPLVLLVQRGLVGGGRDLRFYVLRGRIPQTK